MNVEVTKFFVKLHSSTSLRVGGTKGMPKDTFRLKHTDDI